MILTGIDIGKNSHYYTVVRKEDGEVLSEPSRISNDQKGFEQLISCIRKYPKKDVLIGMEDTGHYHFPLLKYLLDKEYNVALINPVITDLTRKANGSISKNDKLDTLTICDVLSSNKKEKKPYRITKVNRFDLYEQRCLTRHHHDLKEELNVYTCRLQKCIDIVFPEYNSLFRSKYGVVYMNVLKSYGSAESIAKADIRSLRKCFEIKGRGRRIPLTAENLKDSAKKSIRAPAICAVFPESFFQPLISCSVIVQSAQASKGRMVSGIVLSATSFSACGSAYTLNSACFRILPPETAPPIITIASILSASSGHFLSSHARLVNGASARIVTGSADFCSCS